MTLPNLPEVPQNPTLEQLTQIVAEMSQQLTYLLSGFLSSSNAREFGGWAVGNTELQSKTKTVGMSTAQTGADDIRFWAGDLKTGSPAFSVTESGKMTAVNGTFSGAITAGSITGVTITGSNINVSTDVTIGNKLFMSGTNFGNGIKWGTTGIEIYIDPGAGSLRLVAPGGVYANGTFIA